jgi:phenylpyruvate tautomerase PptA (4-oxalocrotonate tautomerase family)
MPLVKISRRVGSSAAENQALLDAVHEALVEGFKIPDSDRHQQLVELDAAHFEIPRERGAGYTLVEITAFPGRSVEAKRGLYQALARRCAAAGVPPQDLFVVLIEPPLENWSPRDGVSSADRRPGFKLEV